MQKTYFLIAPDHFKKNNTKFRRHRIAEALIQEGGSKVYWLYPLKSKKMNTHFIKETLENGVTCLGIPDYYSFGRYSNISDRYFRKLKELVVEKSAIIYTIPIFKNIPKLVGINRVYYDCSDNWTESWLTGKESLKSKLIEKLKLQLVGKEEKSIIKGANKIFVSSIFLQQKVQYQNSGNKIQLVENGVDFSLFNTTNMPNESNSNTELSIGYIGGLKNKVDLKLIELVADEFPNYLIYLIGPIDKNTDISLLKNKTNVRIKAPIPLESVPQRMSQLCLGIMPYRNISYNKGIVPLKLFEYLAVGVPVISIGLPSIKKFEEPGVLKVSDDYEQFINFSKILIEQRNDDTLVNRRIKIAEQNSWEKKMQLIITAINEEPI